VRVLQSGITVAAALLVASCTPPENNRDWECIAPANPGGGWDLACRVTARAMEQTGLSPGPVRVTNIPGAGGGVAFANAVTQRSDHGNVFFSASPATTLRLAQGQFGHLTVDDVRWIGAVAAEYGIIAVSQDAPWETLNDLMADWARDPSSLVVAGGSAAAGQDHMKVMLLARSAGITPGQVRYVPFDGGGEALTALLGGFVSVFPGEASEAEAQLEVGNIRILAILAPERIPGPLADVPTAREQGFDVVWVTWRGFYVPGQITSEEYDRWVGALSDLETSSEWQEVLRLNRLRPFSIVGAEFEVFVREQVSDFEQLSRDIGLIRD
jgi:putative tricarboxylic transport membrane protein